MERSAKSFQQARLESGVKGAYRKTGNEVLKVARQKLAQSGIANAAKLKKGIRLRVYPRGSGFMITVKPHGKQGLREPLWLAETRADVGRGRH